MEDRAKLLAFMTERGDMCNLCGTNRWEWEENPHTYEAILDVCPGCAAKEIGRDDGEKMPPGGTMILVTPAQAAERRRRRAKERSIVQRRKEARQRKSQGR